MSQIVTTRGKKKTSTAVCKCENTGKFLIRINKIPLEVHTDKLLVAKFEEILHIIPAEVISSLTFDITFPRVSSNVGNIYAGRQAFCRAILAYLGAYSDEYKKQEIKDMISRFDRYAVVTDTRMREPKKYGGPGARARYQKSYR